MAHLILMPQLGISEESAVLAAWHVKEGDAVKPGDRLFTLETGKASFDVESEYEGTVLALLAQAGEEYVIKTPVCAVGAPGETVELPKADAPASAPVPVASDEKVVPAPQTAAPERTVLTAAGVSPRARALASAAGVDAAQAAPTGPEGRIIERDVRALIERGAPVAAAQPVAAQTISTPTAAEYTDTPLSTMRKVIAKNMAASLATMAQLTHHHSFDATALLSLRAKCKTSADKALAGITIGDMVLYAVVRTLKEHPALNAHFLDDRIRQFARVNLGVAVDVPGGLLVPTLPDVGSLRLTELSILCKKSAELCKTNTFPPELLTGGTFTVSNLGNLGVEMFTPVINPPQVGILGVCGINQRPRLGANGSVELYPAMGLSLTYDHRAVDGAPASRFLQALCRNLEQFDLLLL